MSSRYLLDTHIVIGLFAAEESITSKLEQSDEVFIPSITIGEVYYGARKSGRIQQNLDRIEEFVTSVTVLAGDIGTARQYGDVKNRYEHDLYSPLL